MNQNYMTVQEAAEILGVSCMTIRNFLLKEHYFNGLRIGRQLRIEKLSFQEYLKNAKLDTETEYHTH